MFRYESNNIFGSNLIWSNKSICSRRILAYLYHFDRDLRIKHRDITDRTITTTTKNRTTFSRTLALTRKLHVTGVTSLGNNSERKIAKNLPYWLAVSNDIAMCWNFCYAHQKKPMVDQIAIFEYSYSYLNRQNWYCGLIEYDLLICWDNLKNWIYIRYLALELFEL